MEGEEGGISGTWKKFKDSVGETVDAVKEKIGGVG